MADFFADLHPLVLCIPCISAFIGWVTNWIVVKATLYPSEFVGISPLLRPVFQKDEWKLVLAGGMIGTIIGVLHVVFLFGGF